MKMKMTHKIKYNPSKVENNSLIKAVVLERQFLGTRIMIFVLALSSLVTLFYNSISFSCQFAILQNGVATFVITALTVSHFGVANLKTRLQRGWWTGAIVGAFPATTAIIISNLQYYLGLRVIGDEIRDHTISSLSIPVLWGELGSQIILLTLLMMLSGVTGLFAALFSSRWQFDD